VHLARGHEEEGPEPLRPTTFNLLKVFDGATEPERTPQHWEKRRQRVQQPSPYVLSILRTLVDRRHYVALGHQVVRQFFD
jgi:hypothetical protein